MKHPLRSCREELSNSRLLLLLLVFARYGSDSAYSGVAVENIRAHKIPPIIMNLTQWLNSTQSIKTWYFLRVNLFSIASDPRSRRLSANELSSRKSSRIARRKIVWLLTSQEGHPRIPTRALSSLLELDKQVCMYPMHTLHQNIFPYLPYTSQPHRHSRVRLLEILNKSNSLDP